MIILNSIRTIKLKIPAKKASPAPPVGPTLGQEGLNINEFCKEFNVKSTPYKNNIEIPTILKVNWNKTYKMILKPPHIAQLIKQLTINVPLEYRKYQISDKEVLTLKQVYELAVFLRTHSKEFEFSEVKSVVLIILGTVQSMGLNICIK